MAHDRQPTTINPTLRRGTHRVVPSAESDTLRASLSMAAGGEGLDDAPGDTAAAAPPEGPSMQRPLVNGLDGGCAHAVTSWEAAFEADLAVMLRRYLAETPPPGPSRFARDAEDWATNLERLGQGRLAALGERRLRSA